MNGKLKKGTTKMISSLYPVSIRVIQHIWKQLKDVGDVSHKKTKNCGRKRVQIDHTQFRNVPLSKRTTLRSLSCALNISKSSLARLLNHGTIRRHSNAIKPFLKEENKISRLNFCLSMLERGSIPHNPTFTAMHNIVHIDEKWFYITKKSMHYYLLPDEEEPLRTCKSKNFIAKVMFLVAVARPRFDAEGNEVFSGKIGVFPFVTQEPAKRNSVNRAAGTLETKPITSVTKEVSRTFLIEKVLPAIREKWPKDCVRDPIFIQQDNARTHIDHNDAEFCEAAKLGGFDIRLMCQPPNSPDLNVLNLGFFSAIQSLQYKEAPKTIDELVSAVERSFEAFSAVQSNRVFLTLQSCMIEIMKTRGSNNYKIPHIKKAILQREGQLPTQMKCDPSIVEDVLQSLRNDSN